MLRGDLGRLAPKANVAKPLHFLGNVVDALDVLGRLHQRLLLHARLDERQHTNRRCAALQQRLEVVPAVARGERLDLQVPEPRVWDLERRLELLRKLGLRRGDKGGHHLRARRVDKGLAVLELALLLQPQQLNLIVDRLRREGIVLVLLVEFERQFEAGEALVKAVAPVGLERDHVGRLVRPLHVIVKALEQLQIALLLAVDDKEVGGERVRGDEAEEVDVVARAVQVQNDEKDEIRVARLDRLLERVLLLPHLEQQRHLVGGARLKLEQQRGQRPAPERVRRLRDRRVRDARHRGQLGLNGGGQRLVAERVRVGRADLGARPVNEHRVEVHAQVRADAEGQVVVVQVDQPVDEHLGRQLHELRVGERHAHRRVAHLVQQAQVAAHVDVRVRTVVVHIQFAERGRLEQFALRERVKLVRGRVNARVDRRHQRVLLANAANVFVGLGILGLERLERVEEQRGRRERANAENVLGGRRHTRQELAQLVGHDAHTVALGHQRQRRLVRVFHKVAVRSNHQQQVVPVQHHAVLAAPHEIGGRLARTSAELGQILREIGRQHVQRAARVEARDERPGGRHAHARERSRGEQLILRRLRVDDDDRTLRGGEDDLDAAIERHLGRNDGHGHGRRLQHCGVRDAGQYTGEFKYVSGEGLI